MAAVYGLNDVLKLTDALAARGFESVGGRGESIRECDVSRERFFLVINVASRDDVSLCHYLAPAAVTTFHVLMYYTPRSAERPVYRHVSGARRQRNGGREIVTAPGNAASKVPRGRFAEAISFGLIDAARAPTASAFAFALIQGVVKHRRRCLVCRIDSCSSERTNHQS